MPANKGRTPDINLGMNEDLACIDEAEALEGIRRGLADVEAGRVRPLEEFENSFRKKHAIRRRSR